MSTTPKVRVLRGVQVETADLHTVRSSSARHLVVDPELVRAASEDGYQDGYRAGFESGLFDAAEAIDARELQRSAAVANLVDELAAAADRLAADHAQVISTIEARIAHLAYDLAEMLVGHELASSNNLGRDGLARALQFAPETGHVHARLHPDDLEVLGEVTDVLGRRTLTLTADASLHPGDCVVDIDATRIDARIAPAFDRIREVLGR